MENKSTDGVWLGLDIGSVSVKGAVVGPGNEIIETLYKRSHGQPIKTTINVLSSLLKSINGRPLLNIGVTGSAGELLASLTGGIFINEIVAQSKTIGTLYPHIRTVVEMGGEDSKMLVFKEESGKTVLEDFSMNNLCAAGTGSFLDQQASRMGYNIEDGEFGRVALKSKKPPRIAGRCSVFAKSDMIHLQQVGTPDYEIVAGLCYAVARTFISNVGRGRKFNAPVAFFGGVSHNAGVVKAMADELGIAINELFIPEECAVTGAIGAAFSSRESENSFKFCGIKKLENYQSARNVSKGSMSPLTGEKNDSFYNTRIRDLNGAKGVGCYIGIDIGSLSTNVVAIDEDCNILARRYLRTQSRPIEAVTRGLMEIGDEIASKVEVLGVATTGSGRYMINDFVGGDVVRNEITAQATAAIHFIPDVDTIFEIGGQDSKYISIDGGAVVDFEMNKVCAAGTGSFIEEQAEKIDLDIEGEFSDNAFNAQTPGKFGDRCTVFIESDLVANQQRGMSKEDLAAGLAYSIVSNYLSRVVVDRKIGDKILFQGGVAWNKAVISAFEAAVGKKIVVPPHHDVTGAIGAAIIAKQRHEKGGVVAPTRFHGFDLRERKYKVTTFECKACDNVCDVSRVKFEDGAHYYGARCEIFEKKDKKGKSLELPDLFEEREELLFGEHALRKKVVKNGKPVIGIPRILYFYEQFPFWKTFLEELGFEVALSCKTNHKVIHDSMEHVKAETCFPIKIVHGHVIDLVNKGVDYIFLPSIITANAKDTKFKASQTCPLVQSVPYIIRSAIDLWKSKVKTLEPPIYFQRGDDFVARELHSVFASEFGVSKRAVAFAVKQARKAQNIFVTTIKKRGNEVMEELKTRGESPVVLISRPYNGCDSGINLGLPRKLREMGKVAIPMDFLNLNEEAVLASHPNMYWRSGQKMIAAAKMVKDDSQLNAIMISNFKCGPDSFIEHHLRDALSGKPCLFLEIDEHSADAGAVTRLEAFFDSLENVKTVEMSIDSGGFIPPVNGNGGQNQRSNIKNATKRKLYVPYMCDHSYMISAALRGSGADAETLPMSDQESLDIGRKHSSGKECIPYALTTGDIIKKAMEPEFDKDKSAFFMPTTNGPCRFGQYQSVQRMVLDSLGMQNTPLLSPDSNDGYSDKGGPIGSKFRRDAWRGVLVVDILQKLLHQARPYEVNKGEADQVYNACLDEAGKIVSQNSSGLFQYVWEIKKLFNTVKIKKVKKPIIGVVGEIYLRNHSFSNQGIIRCIEGLGGEVRLAPIGEWFLYCTTMYMNNSRMDKKYLDLFKGYMQDRIQRRDESRLYEPFHNTLACCEDATTAEILGNAAPYMQDTFEGEAILS
ncbi:Activator of 2-hydroxyglutaryl-CoA dehydratase, partial [hydrothermal vent metagenome]